MVHHTEAANKVNWASRPKLRHVALSLQRQIVAPVQLAVTAAYTPAAKKTKAFVIFITRTMIVQNIHIIKYWDYGNLNCIYN
jgi:hypothetical protein